MEYLENKKNKSFRKKERLSSKIEIDNLFLHGKNFYSFPYKIFYVENVYKVNRVLITIPKKIYKRAVDRNLIKRRIKEAYRLNKEKINDIGQSFNIALIYSHKQKLTFQEIERKLNLVFLKLSQNYTPVSNEK